VKSDNQIRMELGLPIPTPEQLEKRRRRELAAMRFGHAVGPDNILRPIPGAFHRIGDDTRPVCDVPLKDYSPIPMRKLQPVSIDSLIDADGDVNEAEVVIAGEDTEDDDPETTATEQAADSALLPEFGLDDPIEEEADSEQ
jgi:hypothetical protein